MTVKRAIQLLGPSAMSILLAVIFVQVSMSKTVSVQPEAHSAEFQSAFFEAARVYGKAGCGDQKLAEMTARHAVETGLPSQLIAAMAASESGCNPQAISSRGAVGLTQIVPKIWSKEFDFTKINLLNPEQNMQVGTSILSKLVKDHGIKNGLARYYGTGWDDIGLGGAGYAAKVLTLTGKL
jgi:soluble lytic murein transglycosylase-like protein